MPPVFTIRHLQFLVATLFFNKPLPCYYYSPNANYSAMPTINRRMNCLAALRRNYDSKIFEISSIKLIECFQHFAWEQSISQQAHQVRCRKTRRPTHTASQLGLEHTHLCRAASFRVSDPTCQTQLDNGSLLDVQRNIQLLLFFSFSLQYCYT